MKKTRQERKNLIILEWLNTKFKGSELEVEISRYNSNYIMYYLGTTLIMSAWRFSEKTNFKASFDVRFLKEFAIWFPNFKYKRRVLKDWLFSNYDINIPEGCTLYVP
jgi:hypothetical protein